MTIRIYTAKHCRPCHEIEKMLSDADLKSKVELIDIETDDGFLKFKEEVLDFGDGAVPSAYKDGKKCLIRIDEDHNNILLECPTDDPPSSEQY